MIDAADAMNVPLHLAVREQGSDRRLHGVVSLDVERLAMRRQRLDDRRRRGKIAKPQARRQHLRQRADVNHHPGGIGARERRRLRGPS